MIGVELTAQYTNAVLAAVLPLLADYGAALQLNLPKPLTRTAVKMAYVKDLPNISVDILLTNGYDFHFTQGYFTHFVDVSNSPVTKREKELTHLVGEPKLSTNEVITFVRQRVSRLGYPTNRTLLDLPPRVTGPRKQSDGSILPFYWLEWPTVYRSASEADGDHSVYLSDRYPISAEVDAARLRITSLTMRSRAFRREQPRLNYRPTLLSDQVIPRPEYVRAMTLAYLTEATNIVRKLGVPFSLPAKASDIREMFCVPKEQLAFKLADGTQFDVGYDGALRGVRAGDAFFPWPGYVFYPGYEKVDSFFGEWRMTEKEATELARGVFLKLGLPPEAFGVEKPPTRIDRPPSHGKYVIPRYLICWYRLHPPETGLPISKVEVELDAQNKAVKSFYYFNASLLKKPWPTVNESPTNSPSLFRRFWPF